MMIVLAYILACVAVLSALAMLISKTVTKVTHFNLVIGIICLVTGPHWALQQEHRLAAFGVCALWLVDVIILSATVVRQQRKNPVPPPGGDAV